MKTCDLIVILISELCFPIRTLIHLSDSVLTFESYYGSETLASDLALQALNCLHLFLDLIARKSLRCLAHTSYDMTILAPRYALFAEHMQSIIKRSLMHGDDSKERTGQTKVKKQSVTLRYRACT